MSEANDEAKKDCCHGHGGHAEGGCCGGHGHGDHAEGGCCGGHGHGDHAEGGCCGGHGHGDHAEGGCCGGHGHGGHAEGGCCGGHEEGINPDFEMPKDVPLPAPSLLSLTSSIATQAMVSMGIFPNPITGKSEFMLHQAQHLIDTIDLLVKKTEGNRTEEETKTITNMLSELQMLYVAAQQEKSRRDSA